MILLRRQSAAQAPSHDSAPSPATEFTRSEVASFEARWGIGDTRILLRIPGIEIECSVCHKTFTTAALAAASPGGYDGLDLELGGLRLKTRTCPDCEARA